MNLHVGTDDRNMEKLAGAGNGTAVALGGAANRSSPEAIAMLNGFVSRVSSAADLKEALDVGSKRTRAIADRVARATMQNADGFALPAAPGEAVVAPGEEPIDMEAEMVNLADEQLRFEATARLLQKAYEQVRMSMRER